MKAKITKDLIQTIEDTTKVYNEAARSKITPVQAQKKLGIDKVVRGRGLSSFQTHKGIPARIRKEFKEALLK